ncbi:uncharacterized protein [Cicer arietinum]|uniref:Uncharacterized protein LOC101509108 n=1 Tax=Cicer arietinum TaxID=3827 RepID=A0A1S2XBM5_CICAR|nr:uncharacterized protein LOC101509108 [Cicer arietinum]
MMIMVGAEEHVVENVQWPPIGAPLNVQRDEQQQQQYWSNTNFDSSVNAVSFGFVATAILISMFLLMAIFERFLRPSSPAFFPNARRNRRHLHSPTTLRTKLAHPSPKMSVFTSWVSVLMPGDEIPTFIAHPAPVPCCPERISWPSHHQHTTLSCPNSNIMPNINHV